MAAQKSIEQILAELQSMQPSPVPPPPQHQPHQHLHKQPAIPETITHSSQDRSPGSSNDITSLLNAINAPPSQQHLSASLPRNTTEDLPPAPLTSKPSLQNSVPASDPSKSSSASTMANNPMSSQSPRPASAAQPDPLASLREAAADIISWSAALRHLMKLNKLDPGLSAAIAAIIKKQSDRAAVWERDLARADHDIQKCRRQGDRPPRGFANPGGWSSGVPWKLLEAVHSEALQMQRAQAKKLAELGIPFFALKPSLVSERRQDGKLTADEVEAFEQDMVEHLQAMFADE